MFKDAKVAATDKRAQRAIDEGRTILFLSERHRNTDDGMAGDAECVEAAEALGWKLERMSHLMGENVGKNALVSVYQFRR